MPDIINELSDNTALEYLKSIDEKLSSLSQSQAQDRRNSSLDWINIGRRSQSSVYDEHRNNNRSRGQGRSFSDGLEDQFLESIGFNDLQKQMQSALQVFAESFGHNLEDLQYELGKELSAQAINVFKQTQLGEQFKTSFDAWKSEFDNATNQAIQNFASMRGLNPEDIISRIRGQQSIGSIAEIAGGAESAVTAAGAAASGGSMIAAMGASIAPLLPLLGEIIVPVVAIAAVLEFGPKILEILAGPMLESVSKVSEDFENFRNDLGKATNRDRALREREIEAGQQRLKASLEDIAVEPIKILKDAADRMISVWNSQLKVINQTQGYSKAELQSLIGEFAKRIRSEGLDSVIGADSLTENLGKVLQSGLSGKIAEEFAYQATKLTAAVPTEDFFNYASTYASLAANAIRDGKSQSEAIEYANQQLELFASDILYASRVIAGGFTTGLTNASDLFEKSVQIATASRYGNPSQIAGVLSSVSAITGAIAPDLASNIVNAVYEAAVGGNSSQIVALRSLAGINASNTEFLQAFITNPKQVFSTLFNNLAAFQHMSDSNYMEVAEGLSNVFGLDKAAFQRVDFSYLAKAIDNMNVSNASLDENMKLLASGESTLTAEQMRLREINEYMINEGLSYVLDNEVARSIQEHMWDEQMEIRREQATYSVDLAGHSAQLLEHIRNLVQDVIEFLIPVLGLARKGVNLVSTLAESATFDDQIRSVLEAGKIGQGNAQMLHNLTTVGQNLKLTNSYLSMLQTSKLLSNGSVSYSWSTLGKSAYASLGTTPQGLDLGADIVTVGNGAAINAANLKKLQNNFSKMQETMNQFFGTTVWDNIQNAIDAKTKELASNIVITEEQVEKLAQEYLMNPEKYGIGQSEFGYVSKLSTSNIGDFVQEVTDRTLEIAKQRAREDLQNQARASVSSKAEASIYSLINSGRFGQSGYEAWASTSGKFGIADLESAYTEMGYALVDVQSYFEQLEAREAAKQAQQREKNEEAFWSESQRYLDLINTNIHDVLDKGDLMSVMWPGIDTWLNDIDSNGNRDGVGFRGEMNWQLDRLYAEQSSFNAKMISDFEGFTTDWTDYYINHTTYNAHLGYDVEGSAWVKTLEAVKKAETESVEDQWNALAEAIATNPVADLMDPTVQQTIMLSKILLGVQTIIQQNNTQGKLKLPDAISALATGMQVVETDTSTSSSGSPVGDAVRKARASL